MLLIILISGQGPMTFETHLAGFPNYFPNSFSGPAHVEGAVESRYAVSGDVARHDSSNEDNFTQVFNFNIFPFKIGTFII